ncbi:universal minicircle sequence binding protein [Perkinsus olseni]|uniref:Universal minicircle sequence binding protein n=2 Tax=Perkinsus olseni TaxID=32597 RepID=A0A7J6LAP5_PEROL|nr:universal minicircle sequence binding protein [Perkinsus olseni]
MASSSSSDDLPDDDVLPFPEIRSIAIDALIAQVEATWEFYRQYVAVVGRTNAVMRKMEDLITGDPRRVRMRKLEELRRRRDDLRFAIGRENKKAQCLKGKLARVLLQKEECPTSVVKVASRQLESLGYRVKIQPMVGAEKTQRTMLLSLVFCRYYIRLVMLKEITNDLYPIENCSGRYRTIRGFPMTSNGDIAALSQSSEQFPSVAVLYLAHLTWSSYHTFPKIMADTAATPTTTATDRVSSSTCFICNEPGHFARDCPQASSSRPAGRRPMNCYNCGKPDHLARDCPNEQTNQRPCFKCGQVGHFARDCTAPDTRACFRCGQTGHLARDCPNEDTRPESDRAPRGRGAEGRNCFKCGQPGHFARDCPN